MKYVTNQTNLSVLQTGVASSLEGTFIKKLKKKSIHYLFIYIYIYIYIAKLLTRSNKLCYRVTSLVPTSLTVMSATNGYDTSWIKGQVFFSPVVNRRTDQTVWKRGVVGHLRRDYGPGGGGTYMVRFDDKTIREHNVVAEEMFRSIPESTDV